MSEYLLIEARLPRSAGLELSARLMAARPHWDIELDGEALRFAIDLVRGRLDGELGLLEEACGQLERNKNIELSCFWVSRISERPVLAPPLSAGPWRLTSLREGLVPPPAPRPDCLALPFQASASGRFWANESLALSALAEHLTPPPGAPETRGRAVLVLGHIRPLVPTAALLAGAGEAVLLADEAALAFARKTAALNGQAAALACVDEPFKALAQRRNDWRGRFGLIVLHLSPYLAARRLKPLAGWLAADGAVIISGFAPGPQTAHLLRAAARAGLCLSASNTNGDWAALKLEPAPIMEELPPLTGSVVPALVDPPSAREADENIDPPPVREEEPPDEESLMLDEEEAEEEDV